MADQKQSEFPSASTLTGSEYIGIIQSGLNRKSLLSSIKTFVLQGVSGNLLTGLNTATNAVISSTDSVLSAFGKLQAQISNYTNMLSNCTPVLVFSRSAVAVSTTNVTTEEVLATISIPAGLMNTNGQIAVTTLWSCTSSANTKTLRVRFGGTSGTQYTALSVTTVASVQNWALIRNRNSAASQVGFAANSITSFSTSTSAVVTSTVNTAATTTLVITGQKAVGTETLTLESYTIEIIK